MANLGQPYRDSLVSLESPKKKLSRALASRLVPFSSPPSRAPTSRARHPELVGLAVAAAAAAGSSDTASASCSLVRHHRHGQLLTRPPSDSPGSDGATASCSLVLHHRRCRRDRAAEGCQDRSPPLQVQVQPHPLRACIPWSG